MLYYTNSWLSNMTSSKGTSALDGEEVLTHVVGEGGTPIHIHVKDGKIVRIRPIIFDDETKLWKLEVGGQIYTPPKKTMPTPFELAYKRYVQNDKRIKYPMKRVDFDPKGERHPENRGKSAFIRISWEEALDIVANEMKRVKEKYGPSAIFYMHPSHYQKAVLHRLYYPSYSDNNLHPRLFSLFGGCTTMVSNADSWEGWFWGAQHVWGSPSSYWAFGLMEQRDLLEDVMKNAELLITWSSDPESQLWYDGQDTATQRIWLKQLGKRQISITPDLNYDAGLHADKWIPIRPGTDSALAASVAYVWITEDKYDKKYVQTHGYGFDKWKNYILGVEDKIPKTPQWAENITGVKARIIRALAKEWASKKTTLVIKWGAACRVRYATEWPRMMILLQTMQGLGRPGVSIWEGCLGQPVDTSISPPPMVIDPVADKIPKNPVKQMIWRLFLADAILNPPIKWHSLGTSAGMYFLPPEHTFQEYTYPMAGYSEVKMIYRQGSAQLSTWCNTNRFNQAYQSSKIDFIVTQDVWMGGEAPFSDIILPACTALERIDLSPMGRHGRNYKGGVYCKKAIEPMWETKSDYEICRLLAKKLGVEAEFTEGRSEEEWLKRLFQKSSLKDYISWEEFKKKGYHVFRFPDKWDRRPGLRWYYEKKEGQGLPTPSGKIEFFSQRIQKMYPDDPELPAVPKYIDSEESLTSPRAKKYPLILESPHPRYRMHTQHEQNPWLKEIPAHKIYKNGYYYEAIWINPKDAEAREIKYGDVVKVFNERAEVLCAAHVTERMMPGVVRAPDGAWYDPIEPGKPYSVDKGGAVNLLAPDKPISKNAEGMVVNAFLVEVEKWEG
jgi:molybdopterin guanine dinucleotide-containing S/N-oxide reductase-like protein